MTTIFTHPAVERYLAQLDLALRDRPVEHGDDLRDQVRTHIEDALAPDASDDDVTATLHRLGRPGDLVGDDSGPGARATAAARPPTFGGWLRTRSRTWRVCAAVIVLVIAAITTVVGIETNIAPIQGGCVPCGFLFAADHDHVRRTTADDIDEQTVPIRFRQDQAITFTITNPSNFTQRIIGGQLGAADLTPMSLDIATVDQGDHGQNLSPDWPQDFARQVSVPPHATRAVVLHWTQNFCSQPGVGPRIDSVPIRVRTLGVTRTDVVKIGEAFSVVGTDDAGHCRWGAHVDGPQ